MESSLYVHILIVVEFAVVLGASTEPQKVVLETYGISTFGDSCPGI